MQYLGADINKEKTQKTNFLEAEFTKTPLNQARILKLIELGAHFGRAEAQEKAIEVLSGVGDLTVITKLIEKGIVDINLGCLGNDKTNLLEAEFIKTPLNQERILKLIELGARFGKAETQANAIEGLSKIEDLTIITKLIEKKLIDVSLNQQNINHEYLVAVYKSLFPEYPEFIQKIIAHNNIELQHIIRDHSILTEAFLAKDLIKANRYIKCGNTYLSEDDKEKAMNTAIDQSSMETMKAFVNSKIISIYNFDYRLKLFAYLVKNKSPYELFKALLEFGFSPGPDPFKAGRKWRHELIDEAFNRKDYEFIDICIENDIGSAGYCFIKVYIEGNEELINKYKDSDDKLSILDEALRVQKKGLITELVNQNILNINDVYSVFNVNNFRKEPLNIFDLVLDREPSYERIKELHDLGAPGALKNKMSEVYKQKLIRGAIQKKDYPMIRDYIKNQLVSRECCLLQAAAVEDINFAKEIVASFGDEPYMFATLKLALDLGEVELIEQLIKHKIVTDINCPGPDRPDRPELSGLTILDFAIDNDNRNNQFTKTIMMLGGKFNRQLEKNGVQISLMSPIIYRAVRDEDEDFISFCVKNNLMNGYWLLDVQYLIAKGGFKYQGSKDCVDTLIKIYNIMKDGGLTLNYKDVGRLLNSVGLRAFAFRDIQKVLFSDEVLSVDINGVKLRSNFYTRQSIDHILCHYKECLVVPRVDLEFFTMLYEQKDKVINMLAVFKSVIIEQISFYENQIAAAELGNELLVERSSLKEAQSILADIEFIRESLEKKENLQFYSKYITYVAKKLEVIATPLSIPNEKSSEAPKILDSEITEVSVKPSATISSLPTVLLGKIVEFCGPLSLHKSFASKDWGKN